LGRGLASISASALNRRQAPPWSWSRSSSGFAALGCLGAKIRQSSCQRVRVHARVGQEVAHGALTRPPRRGRRPQDPCPCRRRRGSWRAAPLPRRRQTALSRSAPPDPLLRPTDSTINRRATAGRSIRGRSG
jgi:hypothetical protein